METMATDRQTDRQTDEQTNRWTGRLHEAALAVASGGLIKTSMKKQLHDYFLSLEDGCVK